MDPYKFNSWIRILISLCSSGAYLLISLMLPLFVAIPEFETRYGIFFVAPYNDNKYITWYKFETHVCNKEKVFIVVAINLIIVKGMLIYAHFRKHPETFALKHVRFCNKLIILVVCLTITNLVLFGAPFFFFNTQKEFGKTHYLHGGFYILLADFLSHFLIIIFIKRDKTILKSVCELELLPWERKQKLPVHNADYNDTLISPSELTNYLHAIFQVDDIKEDQLKSFFGTDNYEQIYYIIMNNVKAQKQLVSHYR